MLKKFSHILHQYALPKKFLKLARQMNMPLILMTLSLFAVGIYQSLVVSPPDYQQGELVRIMYVHVPAAWMGLMVYSLMAGASAVFLVTRLPLAHIFALSASPIGACFILIALITGSLWGKPTWGTYWAWDARLTSALILFLFYLSHYTLAHAFIHQEIGARRAAWLAIAGFINVPIVKWSVDWWHTLHQPASITPFAKPAIHPDMLTPLLLMATAFLCYFILILMWRMRSMLSQKNLKNKCQK